MLQLEGGLLSRARKLEILSASFKVCARADFADAALHLLRFADFFGQALIVSDFHHQRDHIIIKRLRKFMAGDGCVFHNVMQRNTP